MPTLEDHRSSLVVKMLLLGNSGTGKTGLLATLAKAGYRVIIADFDNGLDILRDPGVLPPEFRKNIIYETFYDTHQSVAGKLLPNIQGYAKFLKFINKWMVDPKTDIGGITSWGVNDVFVIDSLTFFGNMCMGESLKLSGHLGQRPTQPDWGSAIDMQENIIELLYNDSTKCNVVVTSHLRALQDDTANNTTKLMPTALGRKLPSTLSRYFNTVVQVRKKGSGAAVSRELITTATLETDLKNSKPSLVPPIMEPDLAKLFTILKGELQPPKPSPLPTNLPSLSTLPPTITSGASIVSSVVKLATPQNPTSNTPV